MFHFNHYKDMTHHFTDILRLAFINLAALIGVQLFDLEIVLKNIVLLATLIYTIIKIVQALRSWKKKKEIKEED